MPYRLLGLDLDGTLLRRDHSIDARDVDAIAALQRAGVTVTILTGRLQSGSVAAARACAIEGTIACVEGSHLVELATNTTVHHQAMSSDTVREVLDRHELACFVFDAAGIHHDPTGIPWAGYVATWSPNIRIVDRAQTWQCEPLAAVAIGDEAEVERARAALAANPELFTVSFPVYWDPGKHAVLVRAAGPTKGTALAALCKAAGCSVSDAVVVGDWVNDVPMFEVAGRSFAMAGAPERVRGAASDVLVTEAGSGGGIAEAIRRAWG